jgi:hypothetical protein
MPWDLDATAVGSAEVAAAIVAVRVEDVATSLSTAVVADAESVVADAEAVDSSEAVDFALADDEALSELCVLFDLLDLTAAALVCALEVALGASVVFRALEVCEAWIGFPNVV